MIFTLKKLSREALAAGATRTKNTSGKGGTAQQAASAMTLGRRARGRVERTRRRRPSVSDEVTGETGRLAPYR